MVLTIVVPVFDLDMSIRKVN